MSAEADPTPYLWRNRPAECTPGNSSRWRGDCVGPALPYPRGLVGDGPPGACAGPKPVRPVR
jgi:hypothetical protein